MKRELICLFMALLTVSSFAYKLGRVSVHDPSVVWDPESKTYYIFGSHRASAKTADMMSWTAFTAPWATATSTNAANNVAYTTPQVTKVKKGGVEYDLNFDAQAWAKRGNTGYNIDGNLWAPDVIYNKAMKKWCMYMSVNGDNWYSSIVLLTADNIEGPYRYQAPVVISGFHAGNATAYKDTDLEIVIGTQSSLPSRYALKGTLTSGCWGERWPNCIDPCVFYDEQGKLWMSYGSWSGGIFMLELDEETGLRDYDVEYELKGSGNNITVDPYFGKKIAGGNYVSGEASYIEYIGGYYYLFMSYGGLAAGGVASDYNNGGYQMRVFRSENPDGPYVDSKNSSAIFNSYQLNFGANANDGNRGENIFGCYTDWGNQAKGNYGERSQGHNSIIAAPDGRTYLVYHTRFQNAGEGHQVRVHQVFQNKSGWLVAAPFEYTGEQVTSADIATTQQIAKDQIAGKYKLLIHNYKLDHTKKVASKPVEIELTADGNISGAQTGTWNIEEGTSYIHLKIGAKHYYGVMVEQTLEPTDTKVPAFTALDATTGVTAWGYKYEAGSTTPVEPEQPVEATWKYEQDFSSQDGLTIVGGGSFVEDATFGHVYQNGGGAIRSHYLLLPEDVLSHSAETQQMTIAFWVSAANAGAASDYTYAPLFTAYARKANPNAAPMLALQSRGNVQVNCSGWCDFDEQTHVDGKVNVYNQNAYEATNSAYNFVRNWLDDGRWHYYAVTFKANEVVQYLDGEITNQWSLFSSVDGQQVTGLFSNGGDLKYICLGGNQAWDWADPDAKFMFAKLLIQNNAMSRDDIKSLMAVSSSTTYTISITASGNGSATYGSTAIRNNTRSFTVNEGTSATISFTPDDGYRIKAVKVNNSTVSVSNNQCTISIGANTTISVEFEAIPPTTYTLSVTASGNGSATYGSTTIRNNTRSFTVNEGTSATIAFTPDDGCWIKSVKVNNSSVSFSNNQYTINSINANTTVSVEFERIKPVTYTLNITVLGNGSASYDGKPIRSGLTGSFTVNEGTAATITFTPDDGYRIKSVKVNNSIVSVSNNQYTISSINANTTVEVEFEEIPVSLFSVDGFYYKVIEDKTNEVELIKNEVYKSYTGDLIIPETVIFNGRSYKITSIGKSAFFNCSGFTGSLSIPSSVTSIGESAFSMCSGFTGSLSIPSSVTFIGGSAFNECRGFTGSLTIPNTVSSIGINTFRSCGFTGSLVIPNSVTSIGDYAFYGCKGFTGSLTIPNSVSLIGKYSFSSCGFTGSLIIPSSVTSIRESAFSLCSGFTGSLSIPGSVISIGNSAFLGCRGLTSVFIPENVTSIGYSAFYGCI